MSEREPPIQVGRYLLHRKIARGGMATIHIARLMGDVGFSRIVAAKRMHPDLAEDDEFVQMFLDEARIASKVHHRNVVPVLDVVTLNTEVMLVQEYIHGAPLSLLLQNAVAMSSHLPVPVAVAIACNVLAGLHAAHETTDEMGAPLQIVHRDVSPQNIIVGQDGSARLLDFGVAKAAASAHVTRKGTFKGKLGYSSPEQIRGEAGRQSDIYSLGVVLWEMIVGKRLHQNVHGEAQLIAEIMSGRNATITEALEAERSWIGAYRWSQLEALDPIIRKALDVNARRRWATAADMEEALAAAVPVAPAADVSAWLKAVGKDFLDDRDRMIAEEEASWRRAGSTFSIPSLSEHDIVEIPTSTASEPEGTPARAVIWRRGTTAIIAVLAALLVTSIAFLLRDLERSTSPAAPTTASAPSLPVVPAPAAALEKPLTQPVRDVMVRDVMIDKTADEEHEDAESKIRIETPVETVPDKPIVKVRSVAQAPSRSRAVRSPPPRPAPPVRTAAPSPPPKPAVMLDCTTPFYFEGHKKVFKPGCL